MTTLGRYHMLADELAGRAHMDPGQVYHWMMDVARAKQTKPTNIRFIAGIGIIFVHGERGINRLEAFPGGRRQAHVESAGPDFEELILARQEAWMGE